MLIICNHGSKVGDGTICLGDNYTLRGSSPQGRFQGRCSALMEERVIRIEISNRGGKDIGFNGYLDSADELMKSIDKQRRSGLCMSGQ